MKVYNKKFWLKVKGEVGDVKDFLCFSSYTFKEYWRGPGTRYVRKLAQEFLTDTNQKEEFSIGYGGSLFHTPTGVTYGETWTSEEFYQLRNDFVDYCINKFK